MTNLPNDQIKLLKSENELLKLQKTLHIFPKGALMTDTLFSQQKGNLVSFSLWLAESAASYYKNMTDGNDYQPYHLLYGTDANDSVLMKLLKKLPSDLSCEVLC